MNQKEFEGKVVLITGSSSGIGAATAIEFARLGASVSITGRNAEKLENVAKACQDASPFNIKPATTVGDVTNEEDNQKLIDNTISTFGKLDVLVNNAGTNPKKIGEMDMEDFDMVLKTNLRSVYHITKLAIPHLVQTKGNIINNSSISSFMPTPGSGAYATAKSGLDHLSRCLALELAPQGVRVNVVNPGLVRTDLLRDFAPELAEAIFKAFIPPLGRIGEPQDIANIIVFLASDKAAFITGACLTADGGISLGRLPTVSLEKADS